MALIKVRYMDFRVLNLPVSVRRVPRSLYKLQARNTMELIIEGGLTTAEKILPIVNDALKRNRVKRCIMVYQDAADKGSNKVTFKAVAL